MPRLRVDSRPLIKCAFVLCNINFRKWNHRRFCSPAHRKDDWKYNHKPYYAQLVLEENERRKKIRRQAHNYRWAVEGQEEEVPEHLTVSEALAGASPDTLEKIKEFLKLEETQP